MAVETRPWVVQPASGVTLQLQPTCLTIPHLPFLFLALPRPSCFLLAGLGMESGRSQTIQYLGEKLEWLWIGWSGSPWESASVSLPCQSFFIPIIVQCLFRCLIRQYSFQSCDYKTHLDLHLKPHSCHHTFQKRSMLSILVHQAWVWIGRILPG